MDGGGINGGQTPGPFAFERYYIYVYTAVPVSFACSSRRTSLLAPGSDEDGIKIFKYAFFFLFLFSNAVCLTSTLPRVNLMRSFLTFANRPMYVSNSQGPAASLVSLAAIGLYVKIILNLLLYRQGLFFLRENHVYIPFSAATVQKSFSSALVSSCF